MLDELIELFGAERGDVLLRQGRSDELRVVASRDARRRDTTAPGIGLQAFYDHSAASNEAVFKDAGTWNGVSEGMLALPLFEGKQCAGLIGLASRLGRGVFSDSDVDRLNGLAHQIWAALAFTHSIDQHLSRERIKAERAPVAKESYRTLLTSVSDPVLIIDQESLRVLDANEGAARLFERKAEHLLGMSFDKLAALESQAQLSAALRQAHPERDLSLRVSLSTRRRTSVLMRTITGDRSDWIQCVFREESPEPDPAPNHLN